MASLLSGGIASPQLNSGGSDAASGFDWNSEDNVVKWKGAFVAPLQKILNQVRARRLFIGLVTKQMIFVLYDTFRNHEHYLGLIL
jgi:hypothetical protein